MWLWRAGWLMPVLFVAQCASINALSHHLYGLQLEISDDVPRTATRTIFYPLDVYEMFHLAHYSNRLEEKHTSGLLMYSPVDIYQKSPILSLSSMFHSRLRLGVPWPWFIWFCMSSCIFLTCFCVIYWTAVFLTWLNKRSSKALNAIAASTTPTVWDTESNV